MAISHSPCEIPTGHLTREEWERVIERNGGLESFGAVYTVEFLDTYEVINAGWVFKGENRRIRNYVARRMRQDGWNVEVSRTWDPGKGEFVTLEAVRPREP